MPTLNVIKILIGSPAEGKDEIITYLIEQAQAFAMDYCGITTTDIIDNTIAQMVLQDFNRLGNNGLTAQSFNGISESYNQDYSQQVYKQLNKHRKIKTL